MLGMVSWVLVVEMMLCVTLGLEFALLVPENSVPESGGPVNSHPVCHVACSCETFASNKNRLALALSPDLLELQ